MKQSSFFFFMLAFARHPPGAALLRRTLCSTSSFHAASGISMGVTRRAQRDDPVRAKHKDNLAGDPISPLIESDHSSLLVRYMYDGGTLAQGRLCELQHDGELQHVQGIDILRALQRDGVDLDRFYACVRETEASGGSWLPLLPEIRAPPDDANPIIGDLSFPLTQPPAANQPIAHQVAAADRVEQPAANRVDCKLFRRDERANGDAARASQSAQASGKIARRGYFGIGVVGAKNENNLGTLWRSAYQCGAAFLLTVGTRYRSQPTDTVHATTRVPLFELGDWSSFAEWAPRGAKWVAIEFGGTPLEDFEHPLDAVYLLGSEDAGLPTAVRRACHETISLSSENYASYNVAVAGSLVMYDRMTKMRAIERSGRKAGKATPNATPNGEPNAGATSDNGEEAGPATNEEHS